MKQCFFLLFVFLYSKKAAGGGFCGCSQLKCKGNTIETHFFVIVLYRVKESSTERGYDIL